MKPTAAEINGLPEHIRYYVHDLETNADPAGTVQDLAAARDTIAQLTALLDTPEVKDFLRGVEIEAAHQRKRWGEGHDLGKNELEWAGLVSYLVGKAVKAEWDGDRAKAQHHRITAAAALANWHRIQVARYKAIDSGLVFPPPEGWKDTDDPPSKTCGHPLSHHGIGAGGKLICKDCEICGCGHSRAIHSKNGDRCCQTLEGGEPCTCMGMQ